LSGNSESQIENEGDELLAFKTFKQHILLPQHLRLSFYPIEIVEL